MRVALAVIGLLALAGCTPPAESPTTTAAPTTTTSAPPTSTPAETETTTPPPAPTTPAALAPCADGTITPQVNAPEGTAGHLNYTVEFVNSGPECTLEGFPQVAVLGHGDGTQLGDVADQMTDLTPTTVTVAAGGSAYAWLEAVNIDPGGGPLGPDCGIEYGDGWNIWVPGAITPTFVPSAHLPACTGDVVWLRIGPIAAS